MSHPRGPGALTDAHQEHGKMEIAFLVDKTANPFDTSTPSHISMPAARQLVPRLSSGNLSNVSRSDFNANISAASNLSYPDSSRNALFGNRGPFTYPYNFKSSTKPETAHPRRSRKLGSSCPPYSDKQKFSLVFFRGIRRWRWSRILEEFLLLFPGRHRTEKGLTTVYYRTLVEWKMEKSGKDSRYYEND
jgi:hypothetical protein